MKKTNTAIFSNNIYLLKMVWEITPSRVILSFVNQFLTQAIWAYYSVVFMRFIFGNIDGGASRPFHEVALFLVVSIFAMLFINLFWAWYNNQFIKKNDVILKYALDKKIFDKAASVDISCYENPDYYNQYTKATGELFRRSQSVLNNLTSIVAVLLSLSFVIINILMISKVAAVATLLPIIGSLIFGKYANKLQFELNMKNMTFKRIQDYINRTIYLQQNAKEIRMTNIKGVLRKMYDKSYDGILRNVKKASPTIFLVNTVENIFCFPLVFEGVWLYATYCALVAQTMEIGNFIILASAIVSTTWMIRNFSDNIVSTMDNGNYIENIKAFFKYECKINENQQGKPVEDVISIEFRHVGFRYDGQEKPILEDVNLFFTSGTITALVGANGAGKSTIVKLMMRLYDPTEGVILLNGIDIRQYDLKEYRRKVGVIFQDFKLFSMSIIENILLTDSYTQEEVQDVKSVLADVGLLDYIKQLPDGVNTILTKEFDDDGIVLSDGQCQRIALARAIIRKAPLLFFDEPSSALDPIAEYELFNLIHKICSQKAQKHISVFISHRLSSSAKADQIYMIQNGQVIESGTHSELLSYRGAYFDMYTKQAKSYINF